MFLSLSHAVGFASFGPLSSNHDLPIPQPLCHGERIGNEVDKRNIVYKVSRRNHVAQRFSGFFGTLGMDRQVAFEFSSTFGSRELSRGRPTSYGDSKGIVLGIQQAPGIGDGSNAPIDGEVWETCQGAG